MITAIQSLGKYHKLMLGALLGITVVSFVFFGVWSGAQGGGRKNEFLGVDFNDPRAREPYYDLATFGSQRGDLSTQQVKNTIFQLDLATQAQMPPLAGDALRNSLLKLFPNADFLHQYVESLRASLMRGGATTQLEATARIERYFSNVLRMDGLNSTLSGPGYAVPYEAVLEWRLQNSVWEIETATLPASGFNPEIKPDDATLEQFYATVKEAYRIPPVVTASYALFTPTEADLKDVPANTDDKVLQAFIHNNATNLVLPGLDYRKPEVIAKMDDHLKDTNGSRATILKAWRDTQAAETLAGRMSAHLLNQLPILERASTERIKKFVENHKATEHVLPPFHRNNIPGNLPVPATVLQAVFELNPETWRSNVFPVGGNAIVFFHKKTEADRIPPLAEVRDRVAAAYITRERATLFTKHAIETGAKLKAALAAGQPFANAARALGYTPDKPAPFKTSELPASLRNIAGGARLPALIHELLRLPPGGLTPILRPGPDALYARLIQKTAPPATATTPEIQETLKTAAQINSFRTRQSTLNALMPATLLTPAAADKEE